MYIRRSKREISRIKRQFKVNRSFKSKVKSRSATTFIGEYHPRQLNYNRQFYPHNFRVYYRRAA